MPTKPAQNDASSPGGVRSLHRALDLLETLSQVEGNLTLMELTEVSGLPTPTVHRLAQTLVQRGYMRQLPNRSYALGFRLVPLGAAANVFARSNPEGILTDLVVELGETANVAVLSGDQAEYAAQVPSRFGMRTIIEVGRRVELHCTGVGKALLAQLDEEAVTQIVRRSGMHPFTDYTIQTEVALAAGLTQIRAQGYALEDQEHEIGVRCVAVPVDAGPQSWMAVSISGPVARLSDDAVNRAVPLLQAAASRLAAEISQTSGQRKKP